MAFFNLFDRPERDEYVTRDEPLATFDPAGTDDDQPTSLMDQLNRVFEEMRQRDKEEREEEFAERSEVGKRSKVPLIMALAMAAAGGLMKGKGKRSSVARGIRAFGEGYEGARKGRIANQVGALQAKWGGAAADRQRRGELLKSLMTEAMKARLKGGTASAMPGSDKIVAQLAMKMRSGIPLTKYDKQAGEFLYRMKAIPQEFYNAIMGNQPWTGSPFTGDKDSGLRIDPNEFRRMDR